MLDSAILMLEPPLYMDHGLIPKSPRDEDRFIRALIVSIGRRLSI